MNKAFLPYCNWLKSSPLFTLCRNGFSSLSLNPYLILGFVFAFSIGFQGQTLAQCAVSSYPYFENFEAGAGIWSSGGTNSSWTYGTPTKPVINGAGSGQNCWNGGGLTGSDYNNSERATLTSTCFDFSSLNYPFISFKLFWESERNFDGSNLQSSIDGGVTWTKVGAFGDPVNCNTDNWYNNTSVTYLNNWLTAASNDGWSGNIQTTAGSCLGGSGSGSWVLAKHCLTGLANSPNVLLRFTFGSGTTCNAYDGIGIDDITISDGPILAPSFTFSCGNGNTFSFTGTSPCSVANLWSWDFGDPASGNNSSTLSNPTHTFSGPGTYVVTALLAGGPCNPPTSISKTVKVIGGSLTNVQNPSCSGLSDGSAQVNLNFGFAPFTYAWTSGETTATANQLGSGNQSVLVLDSAGCSLTLPLTLLDPGPIIPNLSSTPAGCGTFGTATMAVSGGTAPYTYSWNTNPAQTTAVASNLTGGNYTATVTDANGCTASGSITVAQNSSLNATVSPDQTICQGSQASLTVTPTNGVAPISYVWMPGNLTTANITVSPSTTTNYSVVVTDGTGCSVGPLSVNVTVNSNLSFQHSGDTSLCGGQSGQLYASDNLNLGLQFDWSPGGGSGTTFSISPNQNTTYTVTATDPGGCSSSASIQVSVSPAMSVGITAVPVGCGGLGSAVSNVTGGTSPYTYSWNTTPLQITSTASNLQTGTYSVTVTDGAGCQTSGTTTIVQNSVLVLNLSPDTTICLGDSFLLSATPLNGTAPYTFTWLPGNATTNTLLVNPTSSTTYSISVQDASGCSVGPLPIQVDISPAIQFQLTPDTSVCEGNSLNLIATDNFNQNLQFVWNPGNSQGNSLLVTPTQTQTYFVTATNSTGCSVIDSLEVLVIQPLNPSFSGTNLVGCSPLCVTFTNTSGFTNGCLWDFGDGNSSTAIDSVTRCYTDLGLYTVSFTAGNTPGCLGQTIEYNYVEVTTGPNASFTYSPNDITDPGQFIYLENNSSNASSYSWTITPSSWSSTEINPIPSFPPGQDCISIHLTANDSSRCSDTTSLSICLTVDYTFYIPNAFTIDGDHLNTEFKPKGTGLMKEGYEMKIYDRWGMELFRTKNIEEGWKGSIKESEEIAPQGVYTYRIQTKDIQFQRKHEYFGKVVLIK